MFILVSRCAGESASAYKARFSEARHEFETAHHSYKEEPTADGIMLIASDGSKLYLSYRGL